MQPWRLIAPQNSLAKGMPGMIIPNRLVDKPSGVFRAINVIIYKDCEREIVMAVLRKKEC